MKKEEKENKKVPFGIKIIALLDYLSALILLYIGAHFFLSFGITIIAYGFFIFVVGRGLWKGKKWARLTQMTLSLAGIIILIGLYFLDTDIFLIGFYFIDTKISGDLIPIIVNFIILCYLMLDRDVKKSF